MREQRYRREIPVPPEAPQEQVAKPVPETQGILETVPGQTFGIPEIPEPSQEEVFSWEKHIDAGKLASSRQELLRASLASGIEEPEKIEEIMGELLDPGNKNLP